MKCIDQIAPPPRLTEAAAIHRTLRRPELGGILMALTSAAKQPRKDNPTEMATESMS
jgi:hypothetical protein